MQINKSLLTNIIATLLVVLSFIPTLSQNIAHMLLFSGLFALSGALTNLLAIHMLFEKIPFLYGSGVIPLHFEVFKHSIKELMMQEFFTQEQLDAFLAQKEQKIDLVPIVEQTDFSPAYDALSKTVMESSFGGMLGMFGGEKVIEGLREPFTQKIKAATVEIVQSPQFNATLQEHLQHSSLSSDILHKIASVIDSRLEQLTPQMVKEMVQRLIKEHLGWLVVWGGFFGGLLGFASAFIPL